MDREGLPLSSESGEGKAALNSVMRLWFIADDEQVTTEEKVCRRMRSEPVFANTCFFDTSTKCFRAG